MKFFSKIAHFAKSANICQISKFQLNDLVDLKKEKKKKISKNAEKRVLVFTCKDRSAASSGPPLPCAWSASWSAVARGTGTYHAIRGLERKRSCLFERVRLESFVDLWKYPYVPKT